ncbi:MAG TPA: hypothetical protein VGX28_13895 [Frankiaceae bacterium]|jgi:hypothetical protein|nr:hypothetical protein [Frankiaceae bacterium]
MTDLRASGREQVADWIETSLLVRGTRQLGLDRLHRIALDEVGAGPAAVSLAIRVMSRRGAVLGDHYPFEVSDVAVRARPTAPEATYSGLLLMTPDSPARQVAGADPPTGTILLFERIAVAAAIAMLGPSGRAVRFGWPSDEGRPPEFAYAIEWLAGLMGIKPGSAYRPPRRRDGGVDVVAWRPFPDGRSGFPVMLVQCTLQHDILPKAGDIDVRYWAGWLTLDADPMVALAVPQTIPQGVVWDELALRSLVLERVRLAGLAPVAPGVTAFVSDMIGTLSRHLTAAEA